MLASLFGIVPAILGMYLFLNRYERELDIKMLYKVLGVGMMLGLYGGLFHLFFDRQIIEWDILFFIGYPIMETLFLYVVLYSKWFRGKWSTTYYGVALGLGYAALVTMSWVYFTFINLGTSREIVVSLALQGFLYAALFGSLGGYIGLNSFRKRKKRVLLKSAFYLMPFYFFMYYYYWTTHPGFLIAIIIYVAYVTDYTMKEILPQGYRPPKKKRGRKRYRKPVKKEVPTPSGTSRKRKKRKRRR